MNGVSEIRPDEQTGDGRVPTEEPVLDGEDVQRPAAQTFELRQKRFQRCSTVRAGEHTNRSIIRRRI